MNTGPKRYRVPALARAFRIIEMLERASLGLTKMEIARRIGLPYATAFRLLSTLEEFGYARRDEETGKYFLGYKLLSAGSAQPPDATLRQAAAPEMEALVRATGLTAHLAIFERGEAIYIDKREDNGFFRLNTWIGKKNYVHSTAVGKALLAHQLPDEVRKIWDQGLPKRTARTITSFRRLRSELARIRRLGYALDDEEDQTGGACAAAPVRDAQGAVIAALGLSGLAADVRARGLALLGETVRDAARRISERLGYKG